MLVMGALTAIVMLAGCLAHGRHATIAEGTTVISLTSQAFSQRRAILSLHAMRAVPGGQNISIPYAWSGAPVGTRAYALAVVDRSPVAHNWVHWLVVDIPAATDHLPQGASGTLAMPQGSRELESSFGSAGYGGPQPPPGTGLHPYEATLYALDTTSLPLPVATSLGEFERAVASHTLAIGRLTGMFGR